MTTPRRGLRATAAKVRLSQPRPVGSSLSPTAHGSRAKATATGAENAHPVPCLGVYRVFASNVLREATASANEQVESSRAAFAASQTKRLKRTSLGQKANCGRAEELNLA
eukprot:CAMPEP_0202098912 /NCGR_PEP_ID=MMETSP0965-20130614/2144_1 /ASSEMBLY_ACC=CAM_ASM_000507 /TAXON_ID=4773 /ORGANISM="Schizochytrium aggregatum, Strain ATCC28209" /LENGTH=109 /DNA_ID=CAMNT_0048667417 /DNA_START=204 /DNA_END=530 /DNA_ORIENTATION=+